MRSPDVRITAVVCAYTDKRWDDLVAAVASVRAQTVGAHEVVVVVDHNPALLERARAALDGATVIPNAGTVGLSGARNTGVSAATGDVVAFLDDDAVADPEWLGHLTAGYGDPAVLGVGGTIEPWWSSGPPPGFPAEFLWVVGCSYEGAPTTRSPVRNLIGANMSFRREVLVDIGAFRSGIGRVGERPLGCEETELCLRVARHRPGAVLLHEPLALVRHRVPPDRTAWRYFRRRCWAEGRSKALVTRLAGTSRGLSSERAYATRILPRGVLRGLGDAFVRRDASGVVRATAIGAGLATTTAGYVVETLAFRCRRRFEPMEVEP